MHNSFAHIQLRQPVHRTYQKINCNMTYCFCTLASYMFLIYLGNIDNHWLTLMQNCFSAKLFSSFYWWKMKLGVFYLPAIWCMLNFETELVLKAPSYFLALVLFVIWWWSILNALGQDFLPIILKRSVFAINWKTSGPLSIEWMFPILT